MTSASIVNSPRQDQKMAAVGRLMSGIAHDFNNLLTAILGYGEIVRAGTDADSPVSSDIDEMLKAAERARRLTQQLLAFGRRQDTQSRPLCLNEIVSQLEGMLRRLIREDIDIRLILQDGIRAVTVDPIQIEQVILNLALNAGDAMPNGGTLTIETADRGGSSDVALVVRDNGCGMDELTRQHLFEPFFTTKLPGHGTGLGLSVVHDIVAEARGTISIESELQLGSSFTVGFPASMTSAKREAPGTVSEPSRSQGETVLLVEDEAGLRELASRVLRTAGYRVIEAANGDDALGLLAHQAERIDLLITDVVMPKLGGIELARRLGACQPDMLVIYMSGYSETTVKKQGTLKLDASWIAKPFAPGEFLHQIRRCLDAPRAALPG